MSNESQVEIFDEQEQTESAEYAVVAAAAAAAAAEEALQHSESASYSQKAEAETNARLHPINLVEDSNIAQWNKRQTEATTEEVMPGFTLFRDGGGAEQLFMPNDVVLTVKGGEVTIKGQTEATFKPGENRATEVRLSDGTVIAVDKLGVKSVRHGEEAVDFARPVVEGFGSSSMKQLKPWESGPMKEHPERNEKLKIAEILSSNNINPEDLKRKLAEVILKNEVQKEMKDK